MEWLHRGTREVWVVNPRRRMVAIHRSALSLGEKDELSGGELLTRPCLPGRQALPGTRAMVQRGFS